MSNVDVGYSFMLGVFAALNPCGFVMLPAYLAVFLGIDPHAPAQAGLRRALTVSAALSVAFIAVFTTVGVLVMNVPGLGFLRTEARWAGLVIGMIMVIAGVAALFGWRPPTPSTSRLAPKASADGSLRSMLLFGVAYAVASIGCTIGLFLSVILASFGRHGIAAGVASLAFYGAGMGLLVTALTIAVATARASTIARLRQLSRHLATIAATVVVLTGAYITWYWYTAIFRAAERDRVTVTVGAWQTSIVARLLSIDTTTIAIALVLVVVTAIAVAARKRSRRTT